MVSPLIFLELRRVAERRARGLLGRIDERHRPVDEKLRIAAAAPIWTRSALTIAAGAR